MNVDGRMLRAHLRCSHPKLVVASQPRGSQGESMHTMMLSYLLPETCVLEPAYMYMHARVVEMMILKMKCGSADFLRHISLPAQRNDA